MLLKSYLFSMANRRLLFYSQPIILSISGFILLTVPFIFLTTLGYAATYLRLPSTIMAVVCYATFGMSLTFAFANLFLFFKYTRLEPKESKSIFVNITCLCVNILASLFLTLFLLLWLMLSDPGL